MPQFNNLNADMHDENYNTGMVGHGMISYDMTSSCHILLLWMRKCFSWMIVYWCVVVILITCNTTYLFLICFDINSLQITESIVWNVACITWHMLTGMTSTCTTCWCVFINIWNLLFHIMWHTDEINLIYRCITRLPSLLKVLLWFAFIHAILGILEERIDNLWLLKTIIFLSGG